MLKRIFLGIMIVGLLVGGIVTSVSAYGQNSPVCPIEPVPMDVLGMTAEEIRAEIRSGKTIQELFDEKGLDYQSYVDQWIAEHQTCLEEAVLQGLLSEEQAKLMQERMEARLNDGFMFQNMQHFGNSMWSFMQSRTEKLWGGNGFIGQILENLDITLSELREKIQGGENINKLAEQAGVDLDAIHEERIQSQLDRIDQLLADGKISEDQANRMRERMNNQVENNVPFKMFERMNDRMQDRMDRPFDKFRDGGRPGGAGLSRGNGGCW
ncbi:MAG TPA: hypothetical protein VK856_08805 [Anaerolineaceae bacterium]|nr:hypothetical protein [Anaerolineaceae bacterium]